MKKSWMIFWVFAIFILIVVAGAMSLQPFSRTYGKNMVFHISSNYDGTRIALSSKDKGGAQKWNFYLSDEHMVLLPLNINPAVVFENDFLYTGSQGEKFSLWKGNFSTGKSEIIFKTDKHISYPYMLKNGEVCFIGENLVIKNRAGWDWFCFFPEKGVEKISNNNYYYFKKPFMLEESILGFVQEEAFFRHENVDDPQTGKFHLITLLFNPSVKGEAMLEALKRYVAASNSKTEQNIQCDKQGNVCVSSNTIYAEDNFTYQHEFFIIESTGSKKLDIRLSWGESFTLSGDGKHLFLVGAHGARSEEYFLHQYSRNADGEFVFVRERDLSFIKKMS